MTAPFSYGPGIQAFLVNLLVTHMVSLKRASRMMKTMTGRLIAEATLLRYLERLHHALAEWEKVAIERLLAMPALHVDETSLRVEGKNNWIHILAAGTLTLKVLHPKRGIEAIEAIGVIPRYGGVLVHDCWAAYFSYDQCAHSLCGAHLLRELAYVIEAHDHVWAQRMHKLLLEYCHKVGKLEDKALSEPHYNALRKRYRTILTQGKGELPPVPPRKKGQRGRVAKPDVNNLHERLQTHEDEVLRFARDPHTPFTNNLAERGLRMAKVKQKVSGCFRTTTSAQAYCRISSYLQTMAAKGYSPMAAIEIALKGNAAAMLNHAI